MIHKPLSNNDEACAWNEAAGWDAPVKFRRQQNLLLSAEQRLQLVENMIEMAILAGTFRNKFGEPFPAR